MTKKQKKTRKRILTALVLFLALGNGFAYYVTPDAICQEPLS